MNAMQIMRTGGPEVIAPIDLALPAPGPDELRIRHTAIGLNFVDTYQRSGAYPVALPAILGVEAAGVTEDGRRIAYAGTLGAYATHRNLPAWRAIPIPDHLSDREAAVTLARGITAYMLLRFVVDVKPGMTVLVHAAAGGLGSLLCRWAKELGATVIGTVSTAEKAALVTADSIIVGRDAPLPDGVDVAYDGIGGANLARNFSIVKPFGTVVSLGQAGGPIPPIDVKQLSVRSLSLSRPSVMAFMTDPARYRAAAAEALRFGAPMLGGEYRLAEAARAHAELEAGTTTGAGVLLP